MLVVGADIDDSGQLAIGRRREDHHFGWAAFRRKSAVRPAGCLQTPHPRILGDALDAYAANPMSWVILQHDAARNRHPVGALGVQIDFDQWLLGQFEFGRIHAVRTGHAVPAASDKELELTVAIRLSAPDDQRLDRQVAIGRIWKPFGLRQFVVIDRILLIELHILAGDWFVVRADRDAAMHSFGRLEFQLDARHGLALQHYLVDRCGGPLAVAGRKLAILIRIDFHGEFAGRVSGRPAAETIHRIASSRSRDFNTGGRSAIGEFYPYPTPLPAAAV